MVQYLHADHGDPADRLGSTTLATDAAAIPDSRTWYRPYGEIRAVGSSLPTDFTYTGQRSESSLGLLDYRARMYDPLLARFLSADTVVPEPGNPQALNRYSYCLGNPVRYTDPTGHFSPEQIEQYLRDQYGDKWWIYRDAWKSDTLFWNMLLAAEYDYTLFAPSADISQGTFRSGGNDTFYFESIHSLAEFQGKGPYRLVDSDDDPIPGFDIEKEFWTGGIQGSVCMGELFFDARIGQVWEQPIYRYTDDGPIYTGFNRKVGYTGTGEWRIQMLEGDSVPLILGEMGIGGLLTKFVHPYFGAVSVVASLLTAANNMVQVNFALTVSYVDNRTYIYATPPEFYITAE